MTIGKGRQACMSEHTHPWERTDMQDGGHGRRQCGRAEAHGQQGPVADVNNIQKERKSTHTMHSQVGACGHGQT